MFGQRKIRRLEGRLEELEARFSRLKWVVSIQIADPDQRYIAWSAIWAEMNDQEARRAFAAR